MIKHCKKCGIETERKPSGACRPCHNNSAAKYRAANPDKIAAFNSAYSAANTVKKSAYGAVYYAANSEKVRAARVAYYAANLDKMRAYSAARYTANIDKARAYYTTNIDKARAAQAARQKANPEKCRIYSHNRRAIKRASGGKLSRGLAAKLFKLQRGLCICCKQPLGGDYHLDHIVPIKLGGANQDWNMQLLRSTCNLSKGAKHPIDFMQQRGFLL